MGKPPKYTDRIRIAGLFHDVGKIGVSDEVLTKPTRLCEEEFAQIKTHSAKGEEILSAISLFADIAPIAGQHHERLDGTGYPKGLSGSEIIEEARIISIADAFDAMTSHRQYRDNLSFEQAVDELIRGKGTQFDPEITDVFLELLRTDYETMQSELAWTQSKRSPSLKRERGGMMTNEISFYPADRYVDYRAFLTGIREKYSDKPALTWFTRKGEEKSLSYAALCGGRSLLRRGAAGGRNSRCAYWRCRRKQRGMAHRMLWYYCVRLCGCSGRH